MKSVVAICFVIGAAAMAAGAQVPSAPAASVRGTAVDASGRGVSGVVAVIFPDDESRWVGPESSTQLRRTSVSAGRFDVAGLPAGSYLIAFATEQLLADWPSPALLARLRATKPIPIRVADDRTVGVDMVLAIAGADVTITSAQMTQTSTELVRSGLSPGARGAAPPGRGTPGIAPTPVAPGAISGRVTDADGKPVAGIEVRSMRAVVMNGSIQFLNSGASAVTDADGRYRLVNRQPSDYVVVAEAYSMDRSTSASVAHAPPPVTSADGSTLGYITTFHGGAINQRAAQPVAVATTERTGIDIQLERRRVYDLNGSIEGLPLTSQQMLVTLAPIDSDPGSQLNVRRTVISDSGRFTIAAIPDGEYRLSFSDSTGWTEARVQILGRSPDAVTLTMRPPITVTGRVEFQGGTAPPTVSGLPQFGVEMAPAQLTVGASMTRTPVAPDGTFTARGLGAGPFRLRAVAPSPWVQVAGLVNGIDTLDVPLPGGANVTGALVVLADRPASLFVLVQDAAERAAAGVGVVIFADDPRYWAVPSRRVQVGVTAPTGSCALSNVPPGRYLVVGGRDIDPNASVTPDLLAALKLRAQSIEISAGESKSVRLTLK